MGNWRFRLKDNNMNVIQKLDTLIDSLEKAMKSNSSCAKEETGDGGADLEMSKMNPVVAGALSGAAMGAVQGAMGARKSSVQSEPAEELKKKPKEKVSKKDETKPPTPPPNVLTYQNKPPKENTINYQSLKTPKAPEAEASSMNYSNKITGPTRTPGSAASEAGFKVPKEKMKVLSDPKFRTKLAEQRRNAKFTKSEDFGKITESLTKSLRDQHSDGAISEMLKAAVDSNQLHPHVLIEWINYRTINPAVMSLVQYDDE
jgi:hypothetical protein